MARLGGDEFVVLLEPVCRRRHGSGGQRHHATVRSNRSRLDGRDASSPPASASPSAPPRRQETRHCCAMPTSRCTAPRPPARRATSCSNPACTATCSRRLDLENDLRRAIEKGELRVHYQPIVRSRRAMSRGRGAGALGTSGARPDPAREFIRVAEETGLIVPLGRWVLEQACLQAAQWHGSMPAEPPLMLSVNLSPRQFQQPAPVEVAGICAAAASDCPAAASSWRSPKA